MLLVIRKSTPYIYSFFFLWNTWSFFAQDAADFHLTIFGKTTAETQIIEAIKYPQKLATESAVLKTIDSTIYLLQKKGYYAVLTDSLIKSNKHYRVYLNLGKKIKSAVFTIPSFLEIPKDYKKTSNNTITIPIEKATAFLNSLSNEATLKGRGFSKFSLKNTQIKNQVLFATVEAQQSITRKIDSIVVKGYNQFPKNFLKNYYRLKKNTVFNKETLKQVSKLNNALPFASEIKPPEVLFAKDSTLLYVYLKKVPRSSFDGLVNFSSKENDSGIAFNGYLDVNLVNIFNSGEVFGINWKNNGQEKQSFQLNAKLPYLFNSSISSVVAFSIYKNDSTFLNTKATAAFTTALSRKTALGLFLESENSQDLLNTNQTNIKQFSKYFVGGQLTYQSLGKNPFDTTLSLALGNSTTENNKTKQYKIDFSANTLLKTGKRTAIYLKNESGLLFTNKYLTNELYRLGGINNFRGFKAESIFASKYTFINSEFRYQTVKKSYLYSIFDFGKFYAPKINHFLYTAGLGYSFYKKNTILNISYTYGISSDRPNNNFLNIKMITFF